MKRKGYVGGNEQEKTEINRMERNRRGRPKKKEEEFKRRNQKTEEERE